MVALSGVEVKKVLRETSLNNDLWSNPGHTLLVSLLADSLQLGFGSKNRMPALGPRTEAVSRRQ